MASAESAQERHPRVEGIPPERIRTMRHSAKLSGPTRRVLRVGSFFPPKSSQKLGNREQFLEGHFVEASLPNQNWAQPRLSTRQEAQRGLGRVAVRSYAQGSFHNSDLCVIPVEPSRICDTPSAAGVVSGLIKDKGNHRSGEPRSSVTVAGRGGPVGQAGHYLTPAATRSASSGNPTTTS